MCIVPFCLVFYMRDLNGSTIDTDDCIASNIFRPPLIVGHAPLIAKSCIFERERGACGEILSDGVGADNIIPARAVPLRSWCAQGNG